MFHAIFQFCAQVKFPTLDGNIASDKLAFGKMIASSKTKSEYLKQNK
jgi:hypothetical protein